jgi:hypothetical protein
MPAKPFVKRLPEKLIERLKRNSQRIERNLGKMKNIDHRKDWIARRIVNFGFKPNPRDTKSWGGKIRQMNVSRNYPSTELVIKRVDFFSAEKVIKSIKRKVEAHNRKYKPKGYIVLMPEAHAISKKLIAMQKIDGVTSLLGKEPKRKAFRELLKKNNISLKKFYLEKAKACNRMKLSFNQLFFVGIKEGKIVFMPVLDLL